MTTFTALLLLVAVTASLVPTSCATNLLRKLSVNDGDVSAPNRPSVGDSRAIGEIGAMSGDSALSMRLDTSIQSLEQPSPKESLLVSTTSLTGYLTTAIYIDEACTKLQFASALILNTCTLSGGGYATLTATATDSFRTFYSDKECTKVTSTDKPTTYPSGCTGSKLIYVSANGVPITSSAIVVISRYVVVSITFSCHSRQPSSCCFLRLLMKLRVKKYETTCDLANVTRLKDSLT